MCGGLAEYFGTSPALVRLVFVLSIGLWGGGLAVYLVLWLVMPAAPPEDKAETFVPPGVTPFTLGILVAGGVLIPCWYGVRRGISPFISCCCLPP